MENHHFSWENHHFSWENSRNFWVAMAQQRSRHSPGLQFSIGLQVQPRLHDEAPSRDHGGPRDEGRPGRRHKTWWWSWCDEKLCTKWFMVPITIVTIVNGFINHLTSLGGPTLYQSVRHWHSFWSVLGNFHVISRWICRKTHGSDLKNMTHFCVFENTFITIKESDRHRQSRRFCTQRWLQVDQMKGNEMRDGTPRNKHCWGNGIFLGIYNDHN